MYKILLISDAGHKWPVGRISPTHVVKLWLEISSFLNAHVILKVMKGRAENQTEII